MIHRFREDIQPITDEVKMVRYGDGSVKYNKGNHSRRQMRVKTVLQGLLGVNFVNLIPHC